MGRVNVNPVRQSELMEIVEPPESGRMEKIELTLAQMLVIIEDCADTRGSLYPSPDSNTQIVP